MRRLLVLFCVLTAGLGAPSAFAQTPLTRVSVSVVTSGGLGGAGTYASDMVFSQWAGSQGGWGWAGGASAVQGSAATHTGQPGGSAVFAANEVFSFNLNSLSTTLQTLNATYGTGNWTIANPTLAFQSSYSVQNNFRFGLGSGTFSIYWVANNNWAQSTGTQDNPGLNPPYESSAAALTPWAGSLANLGNEVFTIPQGGSGDKPMSCNLLTSDPNYPLFVSAIKNPTVGAGGYPALTLYLMGTDDTLGMLIFTGGPGGNSEPPPTLGFDVVANVSASPNPVAFSGTALGDSSSTQTFTVTNHSSAVCNVGALTSTVPSEFTIVPGLDTCSGQTIASGATCTAGVVFSPASAGSRSAIINVPLTLNGPTSYNTNLAVTLAGTGGVATVTIAPQALDFGVILLPDNNEAGNVPSGCTDNKNGTVSCTVTVTNTSSVPLSNIGLFTGNGPFLVSPSTISSLAINASATATVTYTATNGSIPQDTGTLTVYAGSDTTSIVLTAVTDARPNTPVNGLPFNGTNASLTPQLRASAFSSTNGTTQKYATWEISTNSQFSFSYSNQFNTADAVVFTSINNPTNLTSLTIPTGALKQGVTYYWSVGYTDNRGGVSLPSAVTSFTVPAVAMNASGTTPLSTTVTNGAGSEITRLSDLASAAVSGIVSSQLLSDLGASAVINSGTSFDPGSSSPTVAIVKASGGASNNVIALVTPPGTNIDQVTTTVPTDPSFSSVPPSGYAFPAGVISFQLTGVGNNNAAQVTFYTPTALPADAVWLKYTPTWGWLQINKNGTYDATGHYLISSATTFAVVSGKGVLTITDNDVADLNPQKGIVFDPGAPAVPAPVALTAAVPDPGAGGGGGGCFIATAAFGSYFNPYVKILRDFRDRFLLTNRLGSAFVGWYYRVSPSVADRIRTRDSLKAGVRAALMPAVGFSALCLKVGALPAILLIGLLLLVAVTLVVAVTWKMRCNRHERQRGI